MANARILYNSDVWDAATITSSSQTGDLVDDNVVDDLVAKPWRTTGKTSEWIKFDLGAATQITEVSLFEFNVTAGATITLQANSSDSFGSPPYSQVLTILANADGVVLKRLVFFLNQTYRWWRITFADASNPDGYIQVGRIKGGGYYEFPRNVSDGFRVEEIDPSEGEDQGGVQTQWRTHPPYRVIAVDFAFVLQAQADKLSAIFRKVGRHTPVVLSWDPDNRPSAESMYCQLKSPLPTVFGIVNEFHQGTLVFEEKNR